MAQTISVSKPIIEDLLSRIERLEKAVFEKDNTLKAIKTYEEEKQKGKLTKLKNIDELFT